MPTKITVRVVSLRTGDVIRLERTLKRDLPKDGRWIAYKPKIIKKRKSKATQRK